MGVQPYTYCLTGHMPGSTLEPAAYDLTRDLALQKGCETAAVDADFAANTAGQPRRCAQAADMTGQPLALLEQR